MFFEDLILLSRKGDTDAFRELSQAIHLKANAYINAALVDLVYSFSPSEREYIFESSFLEAVGNFCFQLKCSFLNYFIMTMHYGFQNLGKEKREFVSSVSSPSSSKVLHDSCQRDENDLMGTLFTWRNDIDALARESNLFTARDLRIVNSRIDNVSFKDIASQEDCCVSTCKKVWKKFLDYAKDILDIRD